jgi:hypothetical protein
MNFFREIRCYGSVYSFHVLAVGLNSWIERSAGDSAVMAVYSFHVLAVLAGAQVCMCVLSTAVMACVLNLLFWAMNSQCLHANT